MLARSRSTERGMGRDARMMEGFQVYGSSFWEVRESVVMCFTCNHFLSYKKATFWEFLSFATLHHDLLEITFQFCQEFHHTALSADTQTCTSTTSTLWTHASTPNGTALCGCCPTSCLLSSPALQQQESLLCMLHQELSETIAAPLASSYLHANHGDQNSLQSEE